MEAMTHSEPLQPSRLRKTSGWVLFGLLQLALLTSLATATVWRDRQLKDTTALPALRTQPRKIVPRYDRAEVVSDEQLRTVLLKLRPRLAGQKPKINHVDHALRFWGIEAEFSDEAYLDGQQMRSLLLNHDQFNQLWGAAARPLLIVTRRGVEVRTREGDATASHTDHTLAGLVEVGTPLSYPVKTSHGQTTLAAMVKASLTNFSLNQGEYEWSALIQALCLEELSGWTTSEGQAIDFNRLCERLMRERLKQGVCFGNHRLFTLSALLQIDEQEHMLSPTTRKKVVEHLQNVTATLVRNQHAYGYWDGNWTSNAAASGEDLKETSNRILATGHALEWWAIAPAEVQPPRETLVRAGQWLAATIDGLEEVAIRQNYTYLTHAGRALALWRGKTPMQAISEHN
jgi:hypothetical protein